jgi:hypothetical protein
MKKRKTIKNIDKINEYLNSPMAKKQFKDQVSWDIINDNFSINMNDLMTNNESTDDVFNNMMEESKKRRGHVQSVRTKELPKGNSLIS